MATKVSAEQLDAAAMSQFFQFLQCQLRLEAEEKLKQEVWLEDKDAISMWPIFKIWASPNLGKKEKWVPFHTVLSPHDFFVVEKIHHNKDLEWNTFQRYLAMIIFRAHCQKNVFLEAQLPYLQTKQFWTSPRRYFDDDGEITQSMLRYRRETRQPLQTSAFLNIPERLLEDNDENLALNVARRSQRLIDIAKEVWPILQNGELSSSEKFEQISRTIQTGHRFGETWAKMLMVSMDIAYPEALLLSDHCDVGIGARKGLLRLGVAASTAPREGLSQVTREANATETVSARHFWTLLAKVESLAQGLFQHLPLILLHLCTKQLSLATVQVQLCEWRQFLEFLDKRARAPTLPPTMEPCLSNDTPVPEILSPSGESEVQPELVDLSDASEEEEEEELLSDLLPQDEATQEYLTRVAEALQQARQQHQELQGKIQRCSQKVKEDELAWKKASQKLSKLAREDKHLAQQIEEVRFRRIQETVQEGPSQKYLKSFEDALENLSIEENQLHQQLELKSSNDTVQLTLTALAPSLRELPRSLASRGALALRRRLATLHRGIRQLCQQNATPQRPKRPPDNALESLQKRRALLQENKTAAAEDMQQAEASCASGQNELIQRRVRLVALEADISTLEPIEELRGKTNKVLGVVPVL